MRFTLNFDLSNTRLPCNYRSIFISFLKNAIGKYKKGEFFDLYYKDVTEKPFTIAIDLGKCSFSKDEIQLNNKIIRLHFSTSDPTTGIHFYNAFHAQKGKPFPLPLDNTMALTNFQINKEIQVISNSFLCSFISPLCVRKHDRNTNRDQYFTFEDLEFESELKTILHYQIKNNPDITDHMIRELLFIPYNCKKVIVKHYEQTIPCTIGHFILKGNIKLLSYLYQTGVASRKSSGFGYFNIISQGGDC